MKRLIIIPALILVFICQGISATNPSHFVNYLQGETLNVFATSGLKLRTAANLKSDVVTVIPYGEAVTVLNHFDLATAKQQRIDWIDGLWIYVGYGNFEGYVFDGYLSRLPIPDDASQFCDDCYELVNPLNNYLDAHFRVQSILGASPEAEPTFTYEYLLEESLIVKRKSGETWWGIELEMLNYRMPEALNLLRSMLLSDVDKDDFEDSLLFKEDREGRVNEIQVKLYDQPISIKMNERGNVLIKAIVVQETTGC